MHRAYKLYTSILNYTFLIPMVKGDIIHIHVHKIKHIWILVKVINSFTVQYIPGRDQVTV